MNTGDKLATVDEVKAVYDIFATEPPLISIPTTMWTGTGPYTSTWTVTGVTANSKLDYTIDETISNLKADLKLTPSTDTVTISTTIIPAGTINVTVIPKATKVGTVEYDLPDNVYSKSQVDTLIQQSTADINNNGLSMRTNVTKGTNPSATQWLTAIRMFQAGSGIANTDRVGGLFEASIDTSGVTKQRMSAYQYTAGSADYNAIDVIIDKNGNKSYAVSDPDAFRSAISTPKSAYLNWGKTLTATNFHHGLLLVGNTAAYMVWFASTSDINIRSLRTGSVTKSASGTITFGADSADGTDYTITRNGATITVTSVSNATISLIYN